MIKLSETSKLGCKSWSLQAIDTCPGSVDTNGGLVEACQGCYATTGNYRFSHVKAPRIHNREDWKREDWVSDMVAALKNERYFRWFDSGDMYDLRLARKILEVMREAHWVKFWLPTRMGKFKKFHNIIAEMNSLSNAVVRQSLDNVFTDIHLTNSVSGYHSVILANPEVETDAKLCMAYQNGGKCGSCRECWNRDTLSIAYPAHGVKMSKVINLKLKRD